MNQTIGQIQQEVWEGKGNEPFAKDDPASMLDYVVRVLIAENLTTRDGYVVLRPRYQGACLETCLRERRKIVDGYEDIKFGT